MKKNKIIALTGTAAVGKSTLAKRLSKELGLSCYDEDAEDNPLLSLWYQDRLLWNYWIQLFFHSRRVVFQYFAEHHGGILERTLYEDLIFLELSLEDCQDENQRNLLESYRIEVNNAIAIHRKADHLIFMSVSEENQKKRILARTRDNEENIDRTYLKRLNNKYDEFFGKNGRIQPSLSLNTDEHSIDEVFNQVLGQIDS